MSTMDDAVAAELAHRLTATAERTAIDQLSGEFPDLDLPAAYRVKFSLRTRE
jgi:hypothetical protein